jgi:hypothetical protein
MNIDAIKESIETLKSLYANRNPQTNEIMNLSFRLKDREVKKKLKSTISVLESLMDNYLESIKNKPINAGKKWEEEEDNSLIRQFDYSKNILNESLENNIDKLSGFHKRSERAIAYRLKLLKKIEEVPKNYSILSSNHENGEINSTKIVINENESTVANIDKTYDARVLNISDFHTHIRSLLADMQSSVDEGPGQNYEMSPNNWHKLHGHFFDKDKIRSARKELQYSMIAWLNSKKSVDKESENIIIDDLKIEIYESDLALIQVSQISLLDKDSAIFPRLRECHSQF